MVKISRREIGSSSRRNSSKKANLKAAGKRVREERQKELLVDAEEADIKVRCKSLIIDSTRYRTRYNKKFENRKTWKNPDPKKIISFIPGTIVKVFIKEGQKVKEGDNMLVLEAMKMKNRVKFPVEGTVRSIRVKEGEKIPKDYVMIEME